jgi:hypothetical protein
MVLLYELVSPRLVTCTSLNWSHLVLIPKSNCESYAQTDELYKSLQVYKKLEEQPFGEIQMAAIVAASHY